MPPVNSSSTQTPRNMEDRDCDTRPRTQTSRSHHRLPKAGTFSNARLPRSNSATGGLSRGRSFQGAKPLTPAAQAAQDGYYHRKAAKMYAEKRKAAAAAKGNGSTEEARKAAGLISITVDHHGVKIDGGNGNGSANGMGTRRNSRSRMSRSSSKRGNGRGDDKENADRPTEAEIDAYFNRKRGETDTGAMRDSPNENTSWDGSMPRRQNSKSFIERQPRMLDANSANSGPDKDFTASKPAEKVPDKQEEQRQSGRRRNKKKGDYQNKRGDNDEEKTQTTDTQSSTPVKVNNKDSKQSPKEEVRVPSMSDVSETEANSTMSSPMQEPKSTPVTPPKDNESQSSGASSYKSSLSKAASHTSEASNSTDAGKWCDECAGVGLHIAALLSDLKKHRALPEAGAEAPPSTSSGSKKGWKSMVTHTMLGSSDSKSKSISEKNRLQNEVTVLRATVEFLYKKIEAMEKSNITASAEQ